MENRRIYRITQEELKKNRHLFERRNNILDEKQNYEFEYNIDYYSNEIYLREYIRHIRNEIEKNFIDLYLHKKNTISKLNFIQPFKKLDFKIFISHSHKDKKLIMDFSNAILKKYKLKCFVDSEVWPYFNDVIEDYVKKIYTNENNDKASLWDISKNVRDIVDIYLIEALQLQLLYSDIIIIIETSNYSIKSPWIRFEQKVIEYIQNNEKCIIIDTSVNNLLNNLIT